MDWTQVLTLLVGMAGILGVFASLINSNVNKRIDDVNRRIDELSRRMDRLEDKIEELRKAVLELLRAEKG